MKRGLLIIRMLLLFLFISVLANQTKSAENVPRSEIYDGSEAGELMLVSVRGHSAIINADMISAERESLKDALRSAVEQAVGTFVSAETIAKNFVLISDKITTKTEGYIKTYEVLYRSQEDGIYTVLIKAQVIPKFVKNDLIALKILQEAMRKPRVMIVIPEQDLNNTSILTEMFPKLAKKYHISDDVTGALIDELSSALKTPSRQSYETALSYVQQAWEELKKQLDSPMYSIYFDTFAHEVMGLSASTEGVPKYRRYLTAAFAAAVRRSATDGRRLTKQQVEALEATLQELYHSEPSVEILDKCTDDLTQAGLDPILPAPCL